MEEEPISILSIFSGDLGLSVQWASFNLGASKPEEDGGYFAWGELEGNKPKYDWKHYKFDQNNSNSELDDIHSDIERFQNTTKYNSIINHLNNLLNDDVMFIF